MEFEWHEAKARANFEAHGVSFELAKTVFDDAFAVDRVDNREAYGEERFVIVVKVRELPRREGRRKMSKIFISNKMLRPISTEAIEKAARADPDAQPLTPGDFKRMKPRPRVHVIRRALGLTQQEFAERYRIPLGTLRDWEQGRAEPDQPTRAYLTLIARDPKRVYRMLNITPR